MATVDRVSQALRTQIDMDAIARSHAMTVDKVAAWADTVPAVFEDAFRTLGATSVQVMRSGRAALTVAVTGHGGNWIVKAHPNVPLLHEEAAALEHWGPGCAPRVLTGSGWMASVSLGDWEDRRDEPGHEHRCVALLASMAAAGVPAGRWRRTDDEVRDRFATASLRALQPGAPTSRDDIVRAEQVIAQARDAFPRQWPTALCHNDLHGRNLFDDGTQVRVIDPRPTVGPISWDLAHWVSCGGPERIVRRVAAVEDLARSAQADVALIRNVSAAACLERALTLWKMGLDGQSLADAARTFLY